MAPMTAPFQKTRKIEDDVLKILRKLKWQGGVAAIADKLNRKLYERVNNVLEALGGQWNKRAKGHLFEGDGEFLVREAIYYGIYVDIKQGFQFFETPAEVAQLLVQIAEIEPGMTVLEPSAGKGAIVRVLEAAGALVAAVEINPDYLAEISTAFPPEKVSVMQRDFLELQPGDVRPYDAVVMNPPFTRQAEIDHVQHAFQFLRPGGRLVSVMSLSYTYRSDKKTKDFREWLDVHEAISTPLEDHAFASSGTEVRTCVVSLRKPTQ